MDKKTELNKEEFMRKKFYSHIDTYTQIKSKKTVRSIVDDKEIIYFIEEFKKKHGSSIKEVIKQMQNCPYNNYYIYCNKLDKIFFSGNNFISIDIQYEKNDKIEKYTMYTNWEYNKENIEKIFNYFICEFD